jgi:hypothetical protein
MSLKDNIRKILKEEIKGKWSTETRGFSRREKGHFKIAEHMLRERHSELVDHNKQREEEGLLQGGYPNDYDEFIHYLKSNFPKYDYYHQLNVMQNIGYFDRYSIPPFYGVKLLTEYILNYQNEGEQQRIDVVPKDELWDYVKEQYFDCSKDFFEHIWDRITTRT